MAAMMGIPALTAVMAGVQVAGTAMQMIAAHNAGEQQKAQANFEANQMEQNANNAQASAEQKMIEQDKQTAYVESNLQAAAAGGGGSATDPTVVTNLKTIAGEGRFRAMTDMYEGNAQAQSLRTQAAATRAGGAMAADAGNINAFAKGVSGASSLFDKYGSVNPDSGSGTPTQLPWQQAGYGNPAAAAFYNTTS
jgi:hypothetical protein